MYPQAKDSRCPAEPQLKFPIPRESPAHQSANHSLGVEIQTLLSQSPSHQGELKAAGLHLAKKRPDQLCWGGGVICKLGPAHPLACMHPSWTCLLPNMLSAGDTTISQQEGPPHRLCGTPSDDK